MKHQRNIIIVAVLAVLALPMSACGSQDEGTSPAARPSVPATTSSRAGSECHLSRGEVDNWGETGSRLESACDDEGRGECHLSQEEVDNWGETSGRLESACESK